MLHNPERTCEQWSDENTRTWQPCPSCVHRLCQEAASQYQAETGSNGAMIKEQLWNGLKNMNLKGHDEWACRVGSDRGLPPRA